MKKVKYLLVGIRNYEEFKAFLIDEQYQILEEVIPNKENVQLGNIQIKATHPVITDLIIKSKLDNLNKSKLIAGSICKN